MEKQNKKYYPIYLIIIAFFGIILLSDKSVTDTNFDLNRAFLIGAATIIFILLLVIFFLYLRIQSMKAEHREDLRQLNELYKKDSKK